MTVSQSSHAQGCGDQWYEVQTEVGAYAPELVEVRDTSPITHTVIRRLQYPVNGIGYHRGSLWGMATTDTGPRLARIQLTGELHDMGPVRPSGPVPVPPSGLAGTSGGTVVYDALVLTSDSRLHWIDLDSASPTYLGIIRVVELSREVSIGDLDFRRSDGRFHAVDVAGSGPPKLIDIDPTDGRVTTGPSMPVLPGGGSYGAVYINPAGLMQTINNSAGGRLSRYRIPLDAPQNAELLETGPVLITSDGAGCAETPEPGPSPSQPGQGPSPQPSITPMPSSTAPSPSITPQPSTTLQPTSSSESTTPSPQPTSTSQASDLPGSPLPGASPPAGQPPAIAPAGVQQPPAAMNLPAPAVTTLSATAAATPAATSSPAARPTAATTRAPMPPASTPDAPIAEPDDADEGISVETWQLTILILIVLAAVVLTNSTKSGRSDD